MRPWVRDNNTMSSELVEDVENKRKDEEMSGFVIYPESMKLMAPSVLPSAKELGVPGGVYIMHGLAHIEFTGMGLMEVM